MGKMAVAFNTSLPALEDELTRLILDGTISARIDSHSKARLFSSIPHLSMNLSLPVSVFLLHLTPL